MTAQGGGLLTVPHSMTRDPHLRMRHIQAELQESFVIVTISSLVLIGYWFYIYCVCPEFIAELASYKSMVGV